jgi:protein-L-isoaspartate(D-aspartate) O-methyltransferase
MGIHDERVLQAVAQVPRHLFVPTELRREAEADRPLPIGFGQTISQPFIVAFMTQALRLAGDERVLEVGTGSGYQTAILALLAREVWSVEIVPELSERAAAALRLIGLENVRLRVGDGGEGWPEAAPFDRIVVTAAPADVPSALVAQLAPGGRLVIPVGADPELQQLELVVRGEDGVTTTTHLLPVRFVPLIGGAG